MKNISKGIRNLLENPLYNSLGIPLYNLLRNLLENPLGDSFNHSLYNSLWNSLKDKEDYEKYIQ